MTTNRAQNPPLGPSYKIWQRETANGRRLRYDLKVIQQPERARACGSGAKCKEQLSRSSAALLTRCSIGGS